MKKNRTGILLVFMFLVGLSLLLYPTISDYWNMKVQSEAIVNYEEEVTKLDESDTLKQFELAKKYNEEISRLDFPFTDHETVSGYSQALNVLENGIMGYITVEKIKIELPIYHGTSEGVLNIAAGHLEGSHLPIGGVGRHSVISAHRGLPSAKLFTNLDKMEPGDIFVVTVLGKTLTYQVDKVSIVNPNEIEGLYPVEGEDYMTLLTCTPYGINTHRLLVRGKRIETIAEKPVIYINTEAYVIDPLIVTPAVAAPMLFILLIYLFVKYKKNDNVTDQKDKPKEVPPKGQTKIIVQNRPPQRTKKDSKNNRYYDNL